MYVSFEGIDGSGKTSVLEALYLKYVSRHDECAIPVIKTREPQGIFRDLVLDPENKYHLNEVARLFLYQADRAVHTENVIKPNWDKLILCDRGILSTLCYQHITTGLEMKQLYQLTEIACDGYMPELIFNFEVTWENSKKRRSNRDMEDHFEKKGREFFERLSSTYAEFGFDLSMGFGIPVINIDTDELTLTEVTQKVDGLLEQALKLI